MNPHQMAQQQCDCYNAGKCLGITVDDDQLKPVRFQPENSKCLLLYDKIQRCQHFESSILPYKPDNKDSRTAAKMQSEWSQGSHEYRIKTGFMAGLIRLCPKCKKNTIGSGRKLCDLCKAENRRESQKNYNHHTNAESGSDSSM